MADSYRLGRFFVFILIVLQVKRLEDGAKQVIGNMISSSDLHADFSGFAH
ncbi:hypothetical protein ACFOEY_19615 [Paracandidimonas soli]